MDMEKKQVKKEAEDGFADVSKSDEKTQSENKDFSFDDEQSSDISFGDEENDDLINFDDVEGSTIFTSAHETPSKKPVSRQKSNGRIIIVMVVAAVLIAAGLLAVILLVPKDKTKDTVSTYSIEVKNVSADKISKVELKNNYGSYIFTSKIVKNTNSSAQATASGSSSASSDTVQWKLEGYDENLIAASSVNAAVDNIGTIYATREMTDKSLDYGLDNPQITATATMRDGSAGYTVKVGDLSPDKTGYYVQIEGSDKIYLVASGNMENLNVNPEKLADTVIVDAVSKDNNPNKIIEKYFDSEGKIATFDNISVSGTKVSKPYSLVANESSAIVSYSVLVGNDKRYADDEKAASLFGILSNGIVSMEAYKLNPGADDIAKYRLKNPEYVVEIKCGSYVLKLKASMYDETNGRYAVIVDGKNAIYSVNKDALTMLLPKADDFYNKYVFLESINSMKNITIETGGNKYSFDLSYDSKEEKISAVSDGKKIDSTLLSSYYEYYTSLAPEVKDGYVKGSTDLKAVFKSDKSVNTITLVRQSDRRYLLCLNGKEMGLVNSTTFENLSTYVKNVVDGKGIPTIS